MQTEIAIIGGGLAGLSLATQLARAGRDFQLFEARHRFGGRVQALQMGGVGFDLGPSWFWPGQHRMVRLVHDLGLERFDQYANGAVSFETETGEVLRNVGVSSMAGAWRLSSGMSGLIEGLVARLPSQRLHLGQEACEISKDGAIRFQDGSQCQAQQIILALPPRLLTRISFTPELAPAELQALEGIPTWMGGHAKFVALYATPFWRTAGLSGDAMSRTGPLAEIHDATGPGRASDLETPAALFGFLGLPAQQRHGRQDAIGQAALVQLSRIFGPQAATPIKTVFQDWAFEPQTAAPLDHLPLDHHPAYGLPKALRNLWEGRLSLCVSEVAPEMGGYLEGALAAAEATAIELIKGQP